MEQEFSINNFMKKIIFFIAFLTSFYSLSQTSLAVITRDVNVRWKPTSKSRIIKTFRKGKKVVVLQTKGNWSFVKDPNNNKKGWVSSGYVELNIKTVTQNANVRMSPGGKILKQIKKGQLVAILMQKGKWRFVRDLSNNKKGWIHQNLISNTVLQSRSVIKRERTSSVLQNANSKNVPKCDYIIITPANGEENVSINPTVVSWKHASGLIEGYYFSLGDNANGDNVHKNINIGNVNSFNLKDLKPKTTYNLSLIPYNDIGFTSCDGVYTFTTGNAKKSPNRIVSSEQIIESRLRRMNKLSSWREFKKINNQRISINDVNKFINTAKSYLGAPYGNKNNWSGIDCSGLIFRGLQSNGINQRLNAQNYAASGKLIANKSSLKPGDLVCFSHPGTRTLVNHISIYLGNNKFLHSPNWGKFVKTDDINDPFYWGDRFIFGVRLNNNN